MKKMMILLNTIFIIEIFGLFIFTMIISNKILRSNELYKIDNYDKKLNQSNISFLFSNYEIKVAVDDPSFIVELPMVLSFNNYQSNSLDLNINTNYNYKPIIGDLVYTPNKRILFITNNNYSSNYKKIGHVVSNIDNLLFINNKKVIVDQTI